MGLIRPPICNRPFQAYGRKIFKHLLIYLLYFLLLPAVADTCWAQNNNKNTEVTVNYAYAAQLGFGGYDVGGLSVNIYTLPFNWTFPLCVTERPWELKVKLPVSYGHFNFEERAPDGTKLSANLDVFSVGAGLELKVPVTGHWSLKPFGTFGLIQEIYSDVSPEDLQADFPFSYYYTTGLRSLVQYDWRNFTFGLGNGLIYAANAAFDGSGNESYSAFEAGIDARHPLGFEIGRYQPDASVFFIYYHFLSPVKFTRFLEEPLEITDQFEFGFSLGFAMPSKIWIFDDPRIGASYLFDSEGELNAFRINFGFPF